MPRVFRAALKETSTGKAKFDGFIYATSEEKLKSAISDLKSQYTVIDGQIIVVKVTEDFHKKLATKVNAASLWSPYGKAQGDLGAVI